MEALLPTVIETPKDEKKDKDNASEAGDKNKEDTKDVLNTSVSEEITLPDDIREMVDEVSLEG